jgi:ribosomal protein S18 acetylase RimI-like enzyme
MDATYEQTADCPELNGLRTTSKTLEGYLASAGTAKVGNPAPEWWGGFEAEPGSGVSGGRPKIAAAFMLGDSGGRFWELSYMGVAPSHRGRRLGNETLYRALTRAQELNARRLTLAVDCRNTYAMRLYREYGFQRIRQLEAWFLAFRK